MYDEKHRFTVLSVLEETPIQMLQKGIREYLLCQGCETNLSKLEQYAKGILTGGEPFNCKSNDGHLLVSGIDYKRFKLFQLSILWRASISSLQFFENVSLGPHQEKIRNMLISGNPGAISEYGCVMFGLKSSGKPVTDMIMQPTKLRLSGHSAFRFTFGGFMWVYFVSSHRTDEIVKQAFINPAETYILIRNIEDAPFLLQFGIKLDQMGRLRPAP